MRSSYPPIKRCFDVVASSVGLVLLSPLLFTIGILVKASSPGPALFRQERIGRGRTPFTLFKFRTMVLSAGGSQITAAGDKRITPVGRILRKYKLDELPQLMNVLIGEMSIVGPRPEVRRYVERFESDYARILRVRPGLTDYAAIEFRDEEAILASAADPERAYIETVLPEKIRLYDEYLKHMSLATDLNVVARTLIAVVR
jgi:lipopolysaccharide/colanic/teichoic acid biosynthesis glycosyltransferase